MKTIRELRQDQGWTQFELALRVGVQPQAVYLWERGRRMPQAPQLRMLGRLFGICSDAIILEPAPDPPASAVQRSHARAACRSCFVPTREGPRSSCQSRQRTRFLATARNGTSFARCCNRRPGEQRPGRDADGRAIRRGRSNAAVRRDDPGICSPPVLLSFPSVFSVV